MDRDESRDGEQPLVRPLGVFGVYVNGIEASVLRPLIGGMPGDVRDAVAAYLRAGIPLFEWMGVTEDVLGGRFQVPGGPGPATDGVYYWRTDAPDYIQEYGIALPEDMIEHCLRNRPPVLSDEELGAVRDDWVKNGYHGSPDGR